jgi:Tol biopolymer transport system component
VEGNAKDGPANLYAVHDVGSSRVPIVTDNRGTANQDRLPSWSPDRGLIAFERKVQSVGSIYVVANDGRHPRQITHPPVVDGTTTSDYWPQWSPDGHRIAFLRTDGDRTDLLVIDRDGTHERALTTDGMAYNGYSWAPDGRRIVFVHGGQSRAELATIRPNGSGQRVITANGRAKFVPKWSPDGERIVFTERHGAELDLDLVVLTPDGKDRRFLTDSPGREINPTWSQDSRFVAYLAFPPGSLKEARSSDERGRLEYASVDTRKVTVLVRGKVNTFPISWQPSARGYPPAGGFNKLLRSARIAAIRAQPQGSWAT